MATATGDRPVVLITGAASGIGAGTAETFADRGWVVYATDIDSSFPATVETGCRCLELDVTDSEQCQAILERVLNEAGRIDVLVNNAGFAVPGPLEDVSLEASRHQFDVLVHGAHAMTQAVLPAMRQQEAGRIVMVSSILGVSATPGLGSYSAAKAAVESLSDSLRMELADSDISVSLIEPAWVDTDFSGTATDWIQDDDRTDDYSWVYDSLESGWVVEGGPLAATPETVAERILEAATDEPADARYPVGRLSRFTAPSERQTRFEDTAARGFNRASVRARQLWESVSGASESADDSVRRLSTGHEVSLPLSTQPSISGVVLSASAAGVDRLLPESLTPVRLSARRSSITLMSVDYNRIGDGGIDPYNEVAIMIPAVPDSAAGRLPLVSAATGSVGAYVWQLPVTTEPARALGDEIWGFNKSVAEIDISTHSGQTHTTLTADGQRMLSLAVEQPRRRRREVSLSAYTVFNGELCRSALTLDGELGARPLSSRVDWNLGDHPWADTLASLELGSRALLRFGGDCEFTIGPPEVVDADVGGD